MRWSWSWRARGRESMAAGIALAVLGEGLRIWASGHIEKTERLATGGPYAHTRNPLYVGSALMALGVAVASASPFVVLAVAAYFAALYPAVIREESAFLAARFPEEYAAWARDVPAFLPRLRPAGPRASALRLAPGAHATASGAPPPRSPWWRPCLPRARC